MAIGIKEKQPQGELLMGEALLVAQRGKVVAIRSRRNGHWCNQKPSVARRLGGRGTGRA